MFSVKLNYFLKSSSLNSPCSSLRLETPNVECFSIHKLLFVYYIIFRFSGYEHWKLPS